MIIIWGEKITSYTGLVIPYTFIEKFTSQMFYFNPIFYLKTGTHITIESSILDRNLFAENKIKMCVKPIIHSTKNLKDHLIIGYEYFLLFQIYISQASFQYHPHTIFTGYWDNNNILII